MEFELLGNMLVRSSLMKSRKRLARDVFDAFATRTGLVNDVIDTAGDKAVALTLCLLL